MDRHRRVAAPIGAANSTAISIDFPEDARIVCTHMLLDEIITGASLDADAQTVDGSCLNFIGGGGNANLSNRAQGVTYRAAGGNPIIPGIHFRFLRYLAEQVGWNPGVIQGPGVGEDKSGYTATTPAVVPYNVALNGTGLNVAHRYRAHVPFYHIVRGGNWSGSLPLVSTGTEAGLDITKAPGHASLFDAQAVSSLDFRAVYGAAVLTNSTAVTGIVRSSGTAAGTLTATGRGFSCSITEALDMPPSRYFFSRLISEVRVEPGDSGTFQFDLREAKGSILTGVFLCVLDDDSDEKDPSITRLTDDFIGEITFQVGGKDVATLDWAEAQEIGRSMMGVDVMYHRQGCLYIPLNADGALRGAQDLTGPNAGNVTVQLSTNASIGGDTAPLVCMIGTLLDPNPPQVG